MLLMWLKLCSAGCLPVRGEICNPARSSTISLRYVRFSPSAQVDSLHYFEHSTSQQQLSSPDSHEINNLVRLPRAKAITI